MAKVREVLSISTHISLVLILLLGAGVFSERAQRSNGHSSPMLPIQHTCSRLRYSVLAVSYRETR